MFDNIKILWYGWVAIGFAAGVYLHFSYARHAIHWLIIQILRGFIWMLHRTDPLYREPKTMIKPDKTTPTITRKPSPDNSEKQLADLLSNPDISIRKIQ